MDADFIDSSRGVSTGNLNEDAFNSALARALRQQRHEWRTNEGAIVAERTNVIVADPLKRPDVLVSSKDSYPIAIECEFGNPAIGDAEARLGQRYAANMLPIRSAIAVGIPAEVRHWSDNEIERRLCTPNGIELAFTQLSSDVVADDTDSGSVSEIYRWPTSGWVNGDVSRLAELCQGATAPPTLVEGQARYIAEHIRNYASALLDATPEDVASQIAEGLGQTSETQGFRLACCIWMTSLRLHDLMTSVPIMRSRGLRTIAEIRASSGGIISLSELRDAWARILDVNFNSIFEPALNALHPGLPTLNGAETLDNLAFLAERVTRLRLGSSIDFAGELFPKLLEDREETAAHYTLPATAALLSKLAVSQILRTDWSSTASMTSLNIADFACGTGTLLRAAYQQVRNLFESSGGDDLDVVHHHMMERGITATDINSLAAHMTCAALSSFDLGLPYQSSNIGAIPIQGGSTGALEFLAADSVADILGEDVVQTASSTPIGATIGAPRRSYDLVIQNPPYTSPVAGTNARRMFDVAGISEHDRQRALDRLSAQRRAVKRAGIDVSHGRAGLGADFSALADIKLKGDGVFATVLPLTAAHSSSWSNFRSHITQNYRNIVAIAYTSDFRSMMSADTHLNEMLLVATKRARPAPEAQHTNQTDNNSEITCVNLNRSAQSVNDAHELARAISGFTDSSSVDSTIRIADENVGDCYRLPRLGSGFPWFLLGMRNRYVCRTLCGLIEGHFLHEPSGVGVELPLPITRMDSVVDIGPTHTQIGHVRGGNGRGAFVFDPVTPGDQPQYPSIWTASGDVHTTIQLAPTHEGTKIPNREREWQDAMKSTSNTFISEDLRFTSQAVGAGRTERNCLGSSTWVALISEDQSTLDALLIWLNSTFGMLVRSGYATTTQPGRARLAIAATAAFPVPDFAQQSDAGRRARAVAREHVERLSKLKLEPTSYAWRDPGRHEIDEVVLEMLDLRSDATRMALNQIRELWCREPSVHGGNKSITAALGIR